MSEYLTRTPTSSGNQKVFTYSCWIKRNKVSDWMRLLSIMNGSTDAIIQLTNVDKLRFRDEVTGPDIDYISSRPLRDVGSWMHLLVAIDTTHIQAEHRIRMYVNGDSLIEHGLDTESMPGDRNLDLQFNDKLEHRFFARNNDSEYFIGEAFDLFWVDGQALTPDVFGFNKDGDGYVSVGSTQATDFRPGQWVPKSPRTIKSEINRRGGFGVNGFYLPMNDSSNFGADFHMTPDTIIKLKGEDLPQPRNGLPTTSDNYVSQLRSDPYAANLVLAVPGVNTQPTGSELITNGTFDTNTTGWTAGNSATLSVDSGRLKVTNGTSSAGYAYQEITVEVGKRYTVNLEGITGTSASNIRIGTSANAADYGNKIGSGLANISLTATSTTLYVTLKPNSNTNGNNAFFDNVVVKQEDAPRDYSADIKGSGTNKTPTLSGRSGVGYELGGYYGSAYATSSNDDYLEFPGTSGDFNVGTGDFTIEMWVNPDSTQPTNGRLFGQDGNSTGNWDVYIKLTSASNQINMMGGAESLTGGDGSSYGNLVGDQWNHFCLERHNGQLTTYVNGAAVYTQSYTSSIGDNNPFRIGQIGSNVYNGITYGFNGEIQDFRFYKGVAKYKGGFDVPKPYTPVGIQSWRQVSDTCKNNFCTMNPLNHNNATFANGNLTTSEPAANGAQIHATMGSNTGKWYYEAYIEDVGSPNAGGTLIGINPLIRPSSNVQNRTAYRSEGSMYNDSGTDSGSSAYAYVAGDTIGVAWDADNKRLWFAKNGTWLGSGDPAGNSNPNVNYTNTETQGPFIAYDNGTGAQVTHLNFGQNPSFSGATAAGTNTDSNGKGLFKYAPPSGFLALCEDNLPTPAIADPGKHFKTVLYTGDGSARGITGVGFKPDFVWIKNRDSTYQHQVYDSVRGAGQKLLPSTTSAESTDTANVSSFDSNGFSFAGGNVGVNEDTKNHVAWCWKAGGAAVTNTDGTITSQVSANQTAGFSIVSYTGTGSAGTVGHGLGKAPSIIITKHRVGTSLGNINWNVCTSLVPGGYLELNTDVAHNSIADRYVTAGTNTNSFPGGYAQFNESNITYISYCWAEIEGYSKFGSYTGNGNADGPFVYCGFNPAWVMVKSSSNGSTNWRIWDSSRGSTNSNNLDLLANTTHIENAHGSDEIDLLSNGFKIRSTGSWHNANGGTYVFMAFAESPFQTANAK